MSWSKRNFKIFCCFLVCFTRGALAQEVPQTPLTPSTFEKFLQFEEKLKTAVCDESVLSHAPSLEGLSKKHPKSASLFWVSLGKDFSEKRILAFMLGDSLTGVFSAYLETALGDAAVGKSEAGFLEKQSQMASLKRKVTLEICQATVQPQLWQNMLLAKPSPLLHALPSVNEREKEDHKKTLKTLVEKGPVLQTVDSDGRFHFLSEQSVYLIPGWIEPFEVDRAFVQNRVYRRFSNPLTNQTQSIQVLSQAEVPLGVLFIAAQPLEANWEELVVQAKKARAQEVQIETYRMMVENEAVKTLQRSPKKAEHVKKLQDFYKNLLQAYLIFPDEKQFESFGRPEAPGFTFQEVHEKILTDGFLKNLNAATVNGGYVRLSLFRPDARLHSIFTEFKKKLEKL